MPPDLSLEMQASWAVPMYSVGMCHPISAQVRDGRTLGKEDEQAVPSVLGGLLLSSLWERESQTIRFGKPSLSLCLDRCLL